MPEAAKLPHEESHVSLPALAAGFGTIVGGVAVALVGGWFLLASTGTPANAPNNAMPSAMRAHRCTTPTRRGHVGRVSPRANANDLNGVRTRPGDRRRAHSHRAGDAHPRRRAGRNEAVSACSRCCACVHSFGRGARDRGQARRRRRSGAAARRGDSGVPRIRGRCRARDDVRRRASRKARGARARLRHVRGSLPAHALRAQSGRCTTAGLSPGARLHRRSS